MFYFSTVQEYIECLDNPDNSALNLVIDPPLGRLKDVQRPLAYQMVRKFCPQGGAVLEAGAGEPVVLEALRLSQGCECTSVDRYLGVGRGPVGKVGFETRYPSIAFVDAYIGEFAEELRSCSFDAVISVSVIEHLSDSEVDCFHEDCVRLIKPGGVIYHSVDVSLDGPSNQDDRFDHMAKLFEHPGVAPLDPSNMQNLNQARRDPCVFTLSPAMWMKWRDIGPIEFDFCEYRRIASLNIGMKRL